MAYCELADVQKLLKWFTFSATSKITSTEVTSYYIPEADSIIDGKLQNVYKTPITDSTDVEILQYISCRMVACEIAHVLILQSDGDLSDIAKRWCEQAKEKLQDVLDRKILLANSTLLDTGNRLYSFTAHGSTFLDEESPADSPTWKMGTDQW